MLDSTPVYVLEYEKDSSGRSMMIKKSNLYINSQNFGVIKHVEKVYIGSNRFLERLLLGTEKDLLREKTIEYKLFDGNYYLFRIQSHDGVNEGTEVKKRNYKKRSELLVNQLFLKKREYDRIGMKENQEDDITLYEQEHKYNPEFWKNYNIILLNPLYKKAAQDLEKEKNLEQQFKENGK